MRLSREQTHTVWDPTIPPVLTAGPGDTVELDLRDASGGQISRASTATDLTSLDAATLNPVTGPLRVEGAEPGDVLVVEIVDVSVDNWGWTANIPGFGLLASDFPDPYLVHSRVAGGIVSFLGGVELPVVPMSARLGLPRRAARCR